MLPPSDAPDTAARGDRAWRPWVFALAAAAAVLAAVLLACSRHGIGLVRDGVSYVAAADSFARGEGLWRHDDIPFALWPPLYPVVLGTLERAGIDVLVAATVLNAIAHAATTVLAFALLRVLVRDARWVVLGTAAVALSLPSLIVALLVASEPLFSALLMGTLLALCTATRRRDPYSWLLPALLAALVCTQRYAGIVVIPVGAIALFVQRDGFAKRARAALGYALVAGLPLGAWLLRNQLVTGTLVGVRTPEPTAAIERQLFLLVANIGDWIVPREWGWRRGLVVAGVVAPLGALLGRWWSSRRRTAREPGAAGLPWFGDPLLLWVFGSLALVLYMSTSTELHLIDMRLLQPVQAPFACLAMVALDGCLRASPRVATAIATALVALLVLAQGVHAVVGVRAHLAQGSYGYLGAQWRDSEILAELSALATPELPIYTNSTAPVYVRLGRRSRRIVPGPRFETALAELESRAPALLVCLDVASENREYPSPLEALRSSGRVELALLAERSDGSIWRVTRARSP